MSSNSEKVGTLTFDITTGIIFMLWLFHLGNPSYYLLSTTEVTICTFAQNRKPLNIHIYQMFPFR